jgi:acetyl-CoA acyltransferase
MRDAYVVTSIRTPGCKRKKGAFKDTRPEDLLSFILTAAVEKTENLEKKDVEDIMIGCSFPEAEQGLNIGRIASQIAGFPVDVTGATVNRFCASGLEAISQAVLRVMAGWSDIVIGGGLESMTYVPMGGNLPRPHPQYTQKLADLYASMGITAENVADRYNVSRESQDEFAYQTKTCLKRSYRRRRPVMCNRKAGPIQARFFCRIMMTASARKRPWRVWPA